MNKLVAELEVLAALCARTPAPAAFVCEANRVLRDELGGRRLRFTDEQR